MRAVVLLSLVAASILGCFGGGEVEPPPPTPTTAATPAPTPEPTPASAREAEAAALVQSLAAGDFDAVAARFDEQVAAAISVQQLGEIWAGLLGQVGDYQQVRSTRSAEEAGYVVVWVTTDFAALAVDVQLTFDAQGRISGLFFQPAAESYSPPAYADPTAFVEREVVVVGRSPWELPGTLTMPAGEDAWPLVVLVHGSGPNDRNESIGPNRPFQDIAWGLASRGIAVLRYDKRTLTHRDVLGARASEVTVEDEAIEDALAAVALARSLDGVDGSRVFVLGHSLGAMLAPWIAERDSALAGIMLLGAPARPLHEHVVEQLEYLASLAGPVGSEGEAQIAEMRRQAARVAALDVAPGEVVLGAGREYWEQLAAYDPRVVAAGLDTPMLVMQGERDYQVTMTDFALWRSAFDDVERVTFRSYPSLNHLFMAGSGPSIPDEYLQPGHVDAAVIADLVEWIRERP